MKHKKEYLASLSTLLHSWGSDTPPEVFWGLNEQIEWLQKEYNVVIINRFEEDWSTTDIVLDELNAKL